MIRTKTTLIVGAGASQEIHLPSGPELLERTAQAYDFYRFGGDQMTKDSTQLLRHLGKLAERPGHSQDKLYEATERLRISARMSSIVPGLRPWGICCHSSWHRCSSQSFSASSDGKRGIGCHNRWRASWTFFSTCPFSQPEAGLQNSASNR